MKKKKTNLMLCLILFLGINANAQFNLYLLGPTEVNLRDSFIYELVDDDGHNVLDGPAFYTEWDVFHTLAGVNEHIASGEFDAALITFNNEGISTINVVLETNESSDFYYAKLDVFVRNPSITSKITFAYDLAGNRSNITYCINQSCSPSSKSDNTKPKIIDRTNENGTVFPNPTHGDFKLQWKNKPKDFVQNASLTHLVSGRQEKLPFKENLNSIEFNISQLTEGVYIVKLQLKDGTKITKKIIKL